MKRRVWLTVFLLVFICLASTAFAEQVVEVWKYPWPGLRDIAASAADGTVWAISSYSGSVVRLAPGADGNLQEVVRVSGFAYPNAIAANSADGSCWVGDCCWDQVVHVAADGTELSWTGGIGQPQALSVDPIDGSCWVVDREGEYVVHLAADGTEQLRTYVHGVSYTIAAVPGTNSCWIGNCCYDQVTHLQDNLDGSSTVLSTTGGFMNPRSLSADEEDGTVWITYCTSSGHVTHLRDNLDGTTTVLSTTPSAAPLSVSAVSGAGAWVVERCGGGSGEEPYMVHVDAGGNVDVTVTGIDKPYVVSADDSNGSCWVLGAGDLTHLGAAGDTLQREPGFSSPRSIAADPNDGSSWVADCGAGRVSHIEGGEVIAFTSGFGAPISVAVNPVDGSVWVGDRCGPNYSKEVVHLAADGSELSRTPYFCCPQSLAIDPNDGSCWVADPGQDCLVQLSADGEIAFQGCPSDPTAVAVDPSDSTVWLGFYSEGPDPEIPEGNVIGHFALIEGEPWLISATGVPVEPSCLVVDAGDSSCLAVLESGEDGGLLTIPVLRVTETPTGPTVAYLGGFARPMSVSVSPLDRSIWVGDAFQVGHMTAEGTVLSRTGAYCCVASVSVDGSDGSCWMIAEESGDVADLAVVPEAEFTADATGGLAPLPVQFTDLSSGPPTTWEWSFGDGGTSTDQDPTHTYGFGLYTVSLTVTGPGGTDTEVKPNFINVGMLAPVADFTADVTSGLAPLPVQFTDRSSGPPTTWAWSFGDGGTSIDQNPTHTYDFGLYTVSLTVTGPGGADTEVKPNFISVGLLAPVADFSASPTSGWAPLHVVFQDESSNDPTSWQWNFGDGSVSAEQNPTHDYADPGSYAVSLTVSNEGGFDTEVKGNYIVVRAPLAPDFSAEPTAGASPLVVSFMDETAGEPASWLWEFGDGATSTAQNPSHSYQTPGFYDVTLTVSDSGGSASTTKVAYVAVGFTDTPTELPGFMEVIACAVADVVEGYEDGHYDPNGQVTRAQMAVYIARALAGGEANVPTGPAEPTFGDVLNTGYGEDGTLPYWAYNHIEYCAANGIVEGYWGGVYRPEKTVDRGQMAVFIARAIATPVGEEGLADYIAPEEPTFPDVTPDNDWSWCYKHVEYCAEHGVVQGYPSGYYRPENVVKRAQMAIYVQRAFDLPMPTP